MSEDKNQKDEASYYPSRRKLVRIKQTLKQFEKFNETKPYKQEVVLIRQAKQKGLEGEDLIDYCYEKMGGAPKLTGEEAEKEIEKEKERRERARRKARPRSKIRAKNA